MYPIEGRYFKICTFEFIAGYGILVLLDFHVLFFGAVLPFILLSVVCHCFLNDTIFIRLINTRAQPSDATLLVAGRTKVSRNCQIAFTTTKLQGRFPLIYVTSH